MTMKPIAISVCCVAAAEIAAQQTSPICIDPPPQSHNATLDAVVARALASLAAPSLSWQGFMRGANLADRAVAVVRVRESAGPPASTLAENVQSPRYALPPLPGGTVANGSSSAPNA